MGPKKNLQIQRRRKEMNDKVFTSQDPNIVFSNIYKYNYWEYGSGKGSLPSLNLEYIVFLQKKLVELNVKKILDIGCGDWQFSKLFDWSPYQYLGVDIVPSVIEEDKKNYEKENIKFEVMNIFEDVEKIPETDVILLKDVLIHWKFNQIKEMIPKLQSKCKYIITTNCHPINPQQWKMIHHDIPQTGHFHILSSKHEPLSLFSLNLFFIIRQKKSV